ncbi:ImmA/IrrE family metallo-endopeptidase [Aquirhabdus parva]|uniref:ImmA/IrrE family metallo-endopeptidase n=1 Tax=Aquirhabdus parva TaxID=2283318 RepID=A0A345P5V7_9GAMM|nr:ImmA/IrrE family metallo-endopeptidase [Aquirhabdus parva]AXI02666.1 ImmA/IrrE family metallo-endopeptidase [Aquirhabdus parva]
MTSALTLDLMELDDKKTPSDVVNEILKQNPNLSYPFPLEAFATLAGIESISELTTDGFEGMLITNPEKSRGAIMIKAGTSYRRRRFTIAHELGHYLLPWHRQESFRCKSSDIKDNTENRSTSTTHSLMTIEIEANNFASELLMPQSEFKRILDEYGTPELIDISDLSDFFDVSFEAVIHRYKVLTDYPLAFVFSHQNTVRYWVKSGVMPYSLKVRKDQPLPLRSPSRQAGEYISDWEAIPAHIWLEPHNEFDFPNKILEQTIYQSAGYKVTMLYVESLAGLEKDNDIEPDEPQYTIEPYYD